MSKKWVWLAKKNVPKIETILFACYGLIKKSVSHKRKINFLPMLNCDEKIENNQAVKF